MINRGNDVELKKAVCFIKVLVVFHKGIFNHSTAYKGCKFCIFLQRINKIPHAETEIGMSVIDIG